MDNIRVGINIHTLILQKLYRKEEKRSDNIFFKQI